MPRGMGVRSAWLTRAVATAPRGRARSGARGGVRRKVPTKMATATRLGMSANRTVILWAFVLRVVQPACLPRLAGQP